MKRSQTVAQTISTTVNMPSGMLKMKSLEGFERLKGIRLTALP
jgi:hypothetical protein